jgi:hypothetical protein
MATDRVVGIITDGDRVLLKRDMMGNLTGVGGEVSDSAYGSMVTLCEEDCGAIIYNWINIGEVLYKDHKVTYFSANHNIEEVVPMVDILEVFGIDDIPYSQVEYPTSPFIIHALFPMFRPITIEKRYD